MGNMSMSKTRKQNTADKAPRTPPKGRKPKSGSQTPSTGKGAPRGNRNAVRHGLRGSKLPKGCQYIENRVNALRRLVEDTVLATKGEISLTDAATINTILKWEKHAGLAAHWLRKEADNLKPVDRLTFSREISRASAERDKAIKALNLDAPPKPIDLGSYLQEAKS